MDAPVVLQAYKYCSAFPFPAPSAPAATQQDRKCLMPLINLVVILIVVGVLLWLVNNYIPMDAKIKQILNIVVVIAVIVWLLQVFGVLGDIRSFRIGK
jgi:undecaprenyl pyrophosphate phosphatase UppP